MSAMTEERARTRWCPFAQTTTNSCVASDCMAWRIAAPQRETLRNYRDDPERIDCDYAGPRRIYPGGWQYECSDFDRDGRAFDLLHRPPPDGAPALGFCGLAGPVTS